MFSLCTGGRVSGGDSSCEVKCLCLRFEALGWNSVPVLSFIVSFPETGVLFCLYIYVIAVPLQETAEVAIKI